MAKLVSDPKPKRVDCNMCFATIEYLPEEVIYIPSRSLGDHDYSDPIYKVKCPREKCPGHGVIK